MSGIEIAGLVLGALPLIIEAMKQYADGATTVKRFIFYEEPLRDLSLELRTQYVICQNTCEELLGGIAHPGDIAGLLQDMDGRLWERHDLKPAVKKRLGRSHQEFVATMIRMGEVVKEIANKLKLDSTYHVQVDVSQKFRREYQRLKFTLQKSEYDELMKTVYRHNTTLSQLVDQSLRHEQAQERYGVYSKLPDFRKIQKYASAIHSLIQKCFNCTCNNVHTASIRLDKPHEDLNKVRGIVRFGLLFSCTNEKSRMPWGMEAAEIEPLEDGGHSKPDQTHPCTVKGKGRIQFVTPEPKPAVLRGPHNAPGLQPIVNICEALCKFKQPRQGPCVGYLLDDFNRKHGLFHPSTVAKLRNPTSLVSLQEVLAPNRALPGFDIDVKVDLAIAVANSMLGLHDTPWIDSYWGKDDILFLKSGDTAEFANPYIWKQESAKSSNGGVNLSATAYQPRNKALFSLGVLLTEIYLGESFEEVLNRNLGGGDPIEALERVIDLVSDKVGEECGNAVRRCIFCSFDCRRIGFEREDFCKMFYVNVVSCLETPRKSISSLRSF
ncbi:uncharacterized protein BKA78DRAFT_291122 [Phyllosticta capitalensis]|uniref:uncharacterized protein n=1 Tax=Phyllosticta capitalensis TaxID=121624 RepID=UPI0031305769